MDHQINTGINRGYKEEEVIEAVIRAVNPGMRVKSYLEDLKQKVLFASQEGDSDLKYDLKLVHCMFLHSLLTGLRSDSIKLELKPNTHVTDEELFEKLIGAVSNEFEIELQQKLGSLNGLATSTNAVPLVAQVTSSKETPTGGTPTIHRGQQNPTFLQKYRK